MSAKEKVEFTVSNRTVLRVVGMVVVAIVGLAAIQKAALALTLLSVAFFLALALNAPVSWVSQHLPGKRRGSRSTATAVSFLIVVAILIGFLASIVPPLVRQTSEFISNIPELVNDLKSNDSDLGRFVQDNKLEGQVSKISSQLSDKFDDVGSTAFTTATSVGGGIFATLTVLVLTFMMLVEGPRWAELARRFVPKRNRKQYNRITEEMYGVIRGYVNGQVLLAATAAISIFVPMLILGIGYPVALLAIVFICGLIPMVGHIIGATIVTLVALFTSPLAAFLILAFYLLYQQIENYVIQPRVQGKTTNMSPLMVFASVLIGVSFSGLLGGLVAIPVAGCLKILVNEYLESRGVGNDKSEPKTA